MSNIPNPYQVQPGSPLGGPSAPIKNYLVESILVTLCCCIPFGIVAIVYAASVGSKQSSGDFQGALEASQKAKQWCIYGVIGGVIGNILVIGVQIAIGFASR